MKSEAFRFEKSFAHSPKPSKPQHYILFNDSNVEQMSYSNKCRKSLLTDVRLRKKAIEFNGDVRFG